jgi:hypothetical protein
MGKPLVLGTLTDYISGRLVDDTEDERYRQRLARLLVEDGGFPREQIEVRREFLVTVADRPWTCRIDFAIRLGDRTAMIVRFAPGSIVSRERPALAAARLLEPYTVPLVVVTNGRDAHVLDAATGEVIGQGLAAIPTRQDLQRRLANLPFERLSEKRQEKERRILHAFEATATCDLC